MILLEFQFKIINEITTKNEQNYDHIIHYVHQLADMHLTVFAPANGTSRVSGMTNAYNSVIMCT